MSTSQTPPRDQSYRNISVLQTTTAGTVQTNTLTIVGAIDNPELERADTEVEDLLYQLGLLETDVSSLTTQTQTISQTASTIATDYVLRDGSLALTGDLTMPNGGNITNVGTVNGVDISALETEILTFPTELTLLTEHEVDQWINIDTATIDAANWGYLASMNQSLATTTGTPTFNLVTFGATSQCLAVKGDVNNPSYTFSGTNHGMTSLGSNQIDFVYDGEVYMSFTETVVSFPTHPVVLNTNKFITFFTNPGGSYTIQESTSVSDSVQLGDGLIVEPTGDNVSRADTVQTLGSGSFRYVDIFAVNGTVQASDEREKTNIVPLSSRWGCDFVSQLKPVSFQWKHHEKKDSPREVGFLAQDVQEAIGEEADRYGIVRAQEEEEQQRLGMYYSQLNACLTQALHELTERINKLV
jgi:hypothetical protein